MSPVPEGERRGNLDMIRRNLLPKDTVLAGAIMHGHSCQEPAVSCASHHSHTDFAMPINVCDIEVTGA